MVNYNNSQLSCNCCESLLKQQQKANLLIVVVDNNSKKEEITLLKTYTQDKDNVEAVFLPDNIGYFPQWRKGKNWLTLKELTSTI